jgi:hypothetical protein
VPNFNIRVDERFKERVKKEAEARGTNFTEAVNEGLQMWLRANDSVPQDEISLIVPRRFSAQLQRLAEILELMEKSKDFPDPDGIRAIALQGWENQTLLIQKYLRQDSVKKPKR